MGMGVDYRLSKINPWVEQQAIHLPMTADGLGNTFAAISRGGPTPLVEGGFQRDRGRFTTEADCERRAHD